MMTIPMRIALAALVLAASGCAVGALGAGVVTKPTVEGTVRLGGTRPLLVDWGPSDRTLFNTTRGVGPLVVRFHDGVLEPLFNCHAKGKYAYVAEHSMQVQDDIIDNADELRAKMPTFGAKFAADLQRAGKLHIRMKVVGMYAADRPTFRREELTGGCEGATAVASYVTVGAFRLFTLSKGSLKGEVAVAVGPEVGGSSSASEQALNEAGDEKACAKAMASDEQPPDGCTTSLQLVLTPLQGNLTDATPPAAERSKSPMTTVGLVVVGIGVVGLATGAVLVAVGSGMRGNCDGNGGCPTQAALDQYNRGTPLLNGGYTSLVAGGAAALAGGILWLTAPSGYSPTTGGSPGVRIAVRPGGVGVSGGF